VPRCGTSRSWSPLQQWRGATVMPIPWIICHSLTGAEHGVSVSPVHQRAVASGRQVPVVLDGAADVARVGQIPIMAPHPLVLSSLLISSWHCRSQC
jgi:hypothetical protein